MFKEKKTKYSSIAQLAERMTVNHDVAGSSPAGGANFGTSTSCSDFFGSMSLVVVKKANGKTLITVETDKLTVFAAEVKEYSERSSSMI